MPYQQHITHQILKLPINMFLVPLKQVHSHQDKRVEKSDVRNLKYSFGLGIKSIFTNVLPTIVIVSSEETTTKSGY